MALTERGKKMAAYLDNPKVRAVLDTIADAEHAQHGYHTAFGGQRLESLASHPNNPQKFKNSKGQTKSTTAAGRYQFLYSTYAEDADRLGLSNFEPTSQDIAAIYELEKSGALQDILLDDYQSALQKMGKTWASLPSSPYPQPTKSGEFVAGSLAENLAKHGIALEEPLELGGPTPEPNEPPPEISGPGGAPSWAAQIANVQIPSMMGDGLPEQLEPWEEQVLARAMAGDAEEDKNDAVRQFMGEDPIPSIDLPAPIERLLRKIVSMF